MKHLLVLAAVVVFAPRAAWADDLDASLPGIPDASVGQGGADMTSEENDTTNAPCLNSSQCDSRTSCVNGKCLPGPVRNAAGCGGGATSSLSLVGLGLGGVALLRRRRHS
jgi:hypothetical protein